MYYLPVILSAHCFGKMMIAEEIKQTYSATNLKKVLVSFSIHSCNINTNYNNNEMSK